MNIYKTAGLSIVFLLVQGFGCSAMAASVFEVPIDIVSFADNDGSNQAVSHSFVLDIFREMNSIQYHPHDIHLYIRSFTVLNHTDHNQLSTGDPGPAKSYVDATIPRDPWVLAAFFTTASWGGGLAWGGGPAPYGISYSDSGGDLSSTELIMSHEVGHNLGLAHLDQYPVGSGMHHSDPGNEDNRMWGGTFFAPWQADIMTSTIYGSLTASSVDGDVNQDGSLNSLDIDDFVSGWLSNTQGLSATDSIMLGDLDLSGKTDLADFAILNQAWNDAGNGPLSASILTVPEPGAIALITTLATVACVLAGWPRRMARSCV